jgi:hypothetical protein
VCPQEQTQVSETSCKHILKINSESGLITMLLPYGTHYNTQKFTARLGIENNREYLREIIIYNVDNLQILNRNVILLKEKEFGNSVKG